MNRRQRRARGGWRCAACATPAAELAAPRTACRASRTRERYRCDSCDSIVTVAIAEDTAGMWVDLRHDNSCPSWRAKKERASS